MSEKDKVLKTVKGYNSCSLNFFFFFFFYVQDKKLSILY
jgi:hypothetical protein